MHSQALYTTGTLMVVQSVPVCTFKPSVQSAESRSCFFESRCVDVLNVPLDPTSKLSLDLTIADLYLAIALRLTGFFKPQTAKGGASWLTLGLHADCVCVCVVCLYTLLSLSVTAQTDFQTCQELKFLLLCVYIENLKIEVGEKAESEGTNLTLLVLANLEGCVIVTKLIQNEFKLFIELSKCILAFL